VFSEFLDFNTTYPIELRDFKEWHKGIKYFGFWAIEITSPLCLNKIKIYQEHLKDKLHPNYLRQAHITLITSGLLSDKHFSNDLILKQVKKIKKSNIKAFTLSLSNANSFSTCPYLCVNDSLDKIDFIRKCLYDEILKEINPNKYIPHVTLGFYNKAYKTSDIIENISTLNLPDIEFEVKNIVFAQYETKDIQGSYEVLHRIKLSR
jgi:2'-5' RNA ligase